ncbi:uncharacterized protein LOC128547466 [Mercenaria mercenaria]|uniref:uncharacterized protein LOC128547466 n=1 Tax=Mercenaria mercenaria TaxID=6596 RepID=UPI00234F38E8|nr:uncharacterized protein LOC128547466 [Mercenaria mercenaria]
MATATKKELSKWLSGYLDELGFDRRRIWERIHVFNRCSRAKDISTKTILKTNEIEKIFVGSMREGTGMSYINDEDILQINHAITSFEDFGTLNETSKLVFKMVQNKAPAGYTFLKLVSREEDFETFETLKYALVKMKKGRFLSSKLFMTKNDDVFKTGDGLISRYTRYKSPQGPSIPKYVENNLIQKYWFSKINLTDKGKDFVRAFPCQADSILQAWKMRDRKCGWPCRKTINHVMSLPAYVVPVGCKDSINEDLQWRICFTMAETHLVQALNNTQTKVFVLMKLIAKYILQPLCKDITSYVVKMVILWLAEKIPQRKFRKKHLLARLQDAITYLQSVVESKHLPSYMIPKRNLFARKLTKTEQTLVIDRLSYLLNNGTRMIEEFSHDCLPHSEEIIQVCESLSIANHMNKIHTCLITLFTTEELANYCTKMFLCRSWFQAYLYNALFVWGPYFLTYGKRGFSDPLSFELSNHFAESEKKEKAAIKQRQKRNTQLAASTQTVPRSDWHLDLNIANKFGLPFEQFVFLSAIFMILLFLPSRFFLKLLLTVLDSDGIITETAEGHIISD